MKAATLWLAAWYGAALLLVALGQAQGFELEHCLQAGRDTYGRLLLPLVLHASLRSTLFALLAVTLSSLIGLIAASSLALLPRKVADAPESLLDFLVAFPSILFALSIAAWIGPGTATVLSALILGLAPSLARNLLARAREIRSLEFMVASRALGAGNGRLVFKHLLPHLIPMVSVKFPALLMNALLTEASLSFLGLGFSAGTESWGTLLAQARDYLIEAPGISLWVGIPLLFSVWSFDVISKRLEPELP
jgi:peptide/nickel transport system permease protein